ncbi:hypothetical protein [Streptomyces sp. CT34]|uniref:hypothetical protein n=1 Tax=Streptomyces sp. CT34 TaxID=1553907 RepID=UPI0005BBD0AA|nr:hypothetical protein [Streptomyces sp. CT34]
MVAPGSWIAWLAAVALAPAAVGTLAQTLGIVRQGRAATAEHRLDRSVPQVPATPLRTTVRAGLGHQQPPRARGLSEAGARMW